MAPTSPLPAADASWDVEISLDLDAVSAICPHCHILLVEAALPYDTDLDAAVQTAAAMGANQISASWTFTASGSRPAATRSRASPPWPQPVTRDTSVRARTTIRPRSPA